MKAVWNGEVIAESDDIVTVENNAYFPLEAVKPGVLLPSGHTSFCSWKGTASYYTVAAAGKENENACWYYPDPEQAAAQIKGRVAFWKGVSVTA